MNDDPGPKFRSWEIYTRAPLRAWWYVGAKSEFPDDGVHEKECHLLEWEEEPNDEELQDIEHLYLVPSTRQIRKPSFPPYLSKFARAWYLALPASLLKLLRADTFPALRTLDLAYDPRFTRQGKQAIRWPEEFVMPNLRGLILSGWSWFDERTASDTDWNWSELGVQATHLPGLEYLEAKIVRGGTPAMEMIAALGNLRHLAAKHVVDFDGLFAAIPENLQYLSIQNGHFKSRRTVSLASITRLVNLRSFGIEDYKAEIDCRIFTQLPRLAELSLNGAQKLIHVEALLECPKLEWLSVSRCGRPFKGALEEEFQARGLRRFLSER